MKSYPLVVQASSDEVISLTEEKIKSTCLHNLGKNVDKVIFSLSSSDNINIDMLIRKKLNALGYYVSMRQTEPYNVVERILLTNYCFGDYFDGFIVKSLLDWTNIDWDYVDHMVEIMKEGRYDLVAPSKKYEYTMAADIASIRGLKKASIFPLISKAEQARALFCPWALMETHLQSFNVYWDEDFPIYNQEKINSILATKRVHAENEFIGRDYSGAAYHVIDEKLPSGLEILDIACGSGFGSEYLSRKAKSVLGVDYSQEYVNKTKERYPETDKLKFTVGDINNVLFGNYFDVVISLHTLEHVEEDEKAIINLWNHVKPGGLLIYEVPIQAEYPLGVPINPYHLREYTTTSAYNLYNCIESNHKRIEHIYYGCRVFYSEDVDTLRDSIQIWVRKND